MSTELLRKTYLTKSSGKIGAFNPRSPLTAVAICCAKAALLSDDIFNWTECAILAIFLPSLWFGNFVGRGLVVCVAFGRITAKTSKVVGAGFGGS